MSFKAMRPKKLLIGCLKRNKEKGKSDLLRSLFLFAANLDIEWGMV